MTPVSSVTAAPFFAQPAAPVLQVLPTAAQPHLALVAIPGPIIDHVRAQQGGRAHSPAASRGTFMTHCANGQKCQLLEKAEKSGAGLSEKGGVPMCARW